MGWSSAALSSTDQALHAADKPILVGTNIMDDASSRWTATKNYAASDATAAAGPTSYLADQFTHLQSYGNAGATTWYLMISIPTGAVFDTMAIINHNFADLTSPTVTVEIGDDATISTNAVTIYSSSSFTSARVVDYSLEDSYNRYTASGTCYAAITVAMGASETPKIGELWLGRRRQLKFGGILPHEDPGWSADVRDFVSDGKVRTRHVFNQGGAEFSRSILAWEDAYVTDLETFLKTDSEQLSRAFLYCDQPSTSPAETYVMWSDSKPALQNTGPFTKTLALSMTEQGGAFVSAES